MEQDKGEVKVVVFDLNGTFYNKSSKEEFYKFLLKKQPNRIKYFFQMGYFTVLLKLKQIKQTEFKENFFNYLDDFPPDKVEEFAKEFWEQEFSMNFNKELLRRFNEVKEKGTVLFCATGGFEIYVKPLFNIYKIDGFAGTRAHYDGHTYLVKGLACKEEEKIDRLEEFLQGKPYRIVEAYSDSEEEILKRAEKAFLIKNGEITVYNS